MKKITRVFFAILLCITFLGASFQMLEAATKYDSALAKWSRFEEAQDDMGGRFLLRATLYTAEYINLLMESEAEKNLWTASELEDYKYNFLRGIQMDDYIAVHLEIENLGATAHMAPFNEMVYLWIGNKKYTPVDYDQRFNLPLQGKRDGLVFFPRYDDKTGEPLLKKDMSLRFVMIGAASPVLSNREIRFTWDVKAESGVLAGTAADRMEVDRLLRRVEKLNGEKTDLETQLAAKNREIAEIMKRINELQGKR
ncbi:troponin [Synergistaceae bacterium OttesenSCG-928-I11]|nr:troponin [Synergistaceae bacterium OttesenSCG-928-I11]